MTCREIDGQTVISWDPVAGATSYVVQFTIGDPDCCEGTFPIQTERDTDTNSLVIPFNSQVCYSWRVLTICGEDKSEWSRKVCMPPGIRCISDPSDGGDRLGREIDSGTNQPISMNAYPNPFSDIINFELSKSNNTQYLSLTDLLGRVVMAEEISPLTTRFELNTSTLIPGIYYAVLKQSDGEVETIKIVKR